MRVPHKRRVLSAAWEGGPEEMPLRPSPPGEVARVRFTGAPFGRSQQPPGVRGLEVSGGASSCQLRPPGREVALWSSPVSPHISWVTLSFQFHLSAWLQLNSRSPDQGSQQRPVNDISGHQRTRAPAGLKDLGPVALQGKQTDVPKIQAMFRTSPSRYRRCSRRLWARTWQL